jgi:hypothetical protein
MAEMLACTKRWGERRHLVLFKNGDLLLGSANKLADFGLRKGATPAKLEPSGSLPVWPLQAHQQRRSETRTKRVAKGEQQRSSSLSHNVHGAGVPKKRRPDWSRILQIL